MLYITLGRKVLGVVTALTWIVKVSLYVITLLLTSLYIATTVTMVTPS